MRVPDDPGHTPATGQRHDLISTSSSWLMPGEVVPLGKYKGQPVEVMAAGKDNCDWLAAQP